MSPPLSRPPVRNQRRWAKSPLSHDDDARSIQAGVILTIILWPIIVWLFGRGMDRIAGEFDGGTALPAQKPAFDIELAPDEFTMPEKPREAPPPPKFVETNPEAPENIPDDTTNFAAQNQQAAQETPAPETKSDRAATEGKKDIESNQVVDGQLQPAQVAPPPAPPPTPEVARALKKAAEAGRQQNPLPGFEKKEGESAEGYGSNINQAAPNATAVPEKTEGGNDTPLVVGNPTPPRPRIDPNRPQPRARLAQNRSRPAVLADNKLGTDNIGIAAINARWSNYGTYLQRLIDSVQVQWERINDQSRVYPPTGTKVTVKFRLESTEGNISEIVDVQSTGGQQAAEACKTAIVSRAPYGKWTDDMIAVLGTSQELTFTFYYGL